MHACIVISLRLSFHLWCIVLQSSISLYQIKSCVTKDHSYQYPVGFTPQCVEKAP